MIFPELIFFYVIAGIIIFDVFYFVAGNFLRSLIFSILIVFVASEFWEIPIFVMAYLGAPGYDFPQFLNHIFVSIMAVLLLILSEFKPDSKNMLVLLENLGANFVFLIWNPVYISSWYLRFFSLGSLTIVFLREVKKNNCWRK